MSSSPTPNPSPGSAPATSTAGPSLIDRVYAILGGAGAGFGLVLVIIVAVFLVYRFLRGPQKPSLEEVVETGARVPKSPKKGKGDVEEGLEKKRKGVRLLPRVIPPRSHIPTPPLSFSVTLH